jgi:hypothetical protein
VTLPGIQVYILYLAITSSVFAVYHNQRFSVTAFKISQTIPHPEKCLSISSHAYNPLEDLRQIQASKSKEGIER